MIGMMSFTVVKGGADLNSKRHFHVKNCKRLRELKMGCGSFSDCSVCVIENVPSLEVIEMGKVDEYCCNFYNASLELKSNSEGMK